jgi:hypothetical protein
MPFNPTNYPPNWKEFTYHIRFTRARGQCECTGQCGLHAPNPQTRRCTETHGQHAKFARGRVRLTTAHLCNCPTPCTNPAHVIAACQRCHLRIDRKLHALHARLTRLNKQKNPLPIPLQLT